MSKPVQSMTALLLCWVMSSVLPDCVIVACPGRTTPPVGLAYAGGGNTKENATERQVMQLIVFLTNPMPQTYLVYYIILTLLDKDLVNT